MTENQCGASHNATAATAVRCGAHQLKFHKSCRREDGTRRSPVLIYKDGSAEHTQLTPGWSGVMAVDRYDRIHHFAGADAGWPKLRWVDAWVRGGGRLASDDSPAKPHNAPISATEARQS